MNLFGTKDPAPVRDFIGEAEKAAAGSQESRWAKALAPVLALVTACSPGGGTTQAAPSIAPTGTPPSPAAGPVAGAPLTAVRYDNGVVVEPWGDQSVQVVQPFDGRRFDASVTLAGADDAGGQAPIVLTVPQTATPWNVQWGVDGIQKSVGSANYDNDALQEFLDSGPGCATLPSGAHKVQETVTNEQGGVAQIGVDFTVADGRCDFPKDREVATVTFSGGGWEQ